jgi:hypothetical protein
MEGHNERHTPVTSDGKLSVVLENSDGTSSVVLKKAFVNDHLRKVLSSGPLTPEQLADVLDEPHTRRAWWLDLHSSADIHAGTTISDLQAAVGRAGGGRFDGCNNTATRNGSNGQPSAAPISFAPERCACNGSGLSLITAPRSPCRCAAPNVKGVIPSPLMDEQRSDYLEAL